MIYWCQLIALHACLFKEYTVRQDTSLLSLPSRVFPATINHYHILWYIAYFDVLLFYNYHSDNRIRGKTVDWHNIIFWWSRKQFEAFNIETRSAAYLLVVIVVHNVVCFRCWRRWTDRLDSRERQAHCLVNNCYLLGVSSVPHPQCFQIYTKNIFLHNQAWRWQCVRLPWPPYICLS